MKAIVAIALTVGCGLFSWEPNQAHTYNIQYGDSVLTNQFQEDIIPIIQADTDEWQTATEDYIKFNYDAFQSSNEGVITIHTATLDELRSKPLTHGDSVGITYWHGSNADIWIPNNIPYDLLRVVLLHELGHSLGIASHLGEGSIMYYDVGSVEHLTCVDVAGLCSAWNDQVSDQNKNCDAAKWLICNGGQ